MVGIPPRYAVHGDGTVTDTTTGLMWEYDPPKVRRTWHEAHDYCKALRLGGYGDWRLPSIQELFSIIDYTRAHPACELPTVSVNYWSATSLATNPGLAWYVFFVDGFVNLVFKVNGSFVRAVRGGSLDPSVIRPI